MGTMQNSLDLIKKNESVLLPDGLFGLRTRRPRRVTTSTITHGSTTIVESGPYQVPFGGVGRSLTPSRKNVVLESPNPSATETEWNDEYFPPFQLGKVNEDLFSVDFSH